MSRYRRTRTRVALFVAAMVAPLLVFSPPAGADEPAPVPVTLHVFRSSSPYPRTLNMNVRVHSATGAVPKGTVTFYLVGQTFPESDPIPVGPGGRATAEVGTFTGSINPVWRAEFTGTDGFADGVGAEGDEGDITVTGLPTVLALGGPNLLSIPLTTSVKVLREDGYPDEGAMVEFTYPPGSSSFTVPNETQVCLAYADLNGLASCKGKGSTAALVSLLGGAVRAHTLKLTTGTFVHTKLPVVAAVR